MYCCMTGPGDLCRARVAWVQRVQPEVPTRRLGRGSHVHNCCTRKDLACNISQVGLGIRPCAPVENFRKSRRGAWRFRIEGAARGRYPLL